MISLSVELNKEVLVLEGSEPAKSLQREWAKCFVESTGLRFENSFDVSKFVSDSFDDPTTDRSMLAREEVRLAVAAFGCEETALKPLDDMRQELTTKFLAENSGRIKHVDVP